ncbi:NAD-dependent protein deacetylase [Haliea sp. E1-2-M8]|uniref:NAD-dependent protein deacetylase n=1 Tax=Haliea sp. E1-2-M8 TaxID=3064706 RepID=UPI00271A3CF2|nr:NAD-dependent protein deacetylase [Haliea sp. E1-2-M8]MDO8861855.1 NAD-dependent protein deacetylase [Haliea sp. E1-2-M8]
MNNIGPELQQLLTLLRRRPRLVVLTGAGISASSGIPTYRDADGQWLYSTPIQHRDFLQDPATRQRYWTRSWLGWPGVRDASPNAAHRALATLERAGAIELLVTQNVDRLHQRAGSDAVVDLHGRLDRVRCLTCGSYSPRQEMQGRLLQANPHLASLEADAGSRPDGDMSLPDGQAQHTVVPPCPVCAGTLIPDVVFFGGTVPRERVERVSAAIDSADALLVVGSSLQVYSGFRFCRAAHAAGKPLVLLNPGITRADSIASLKFATPCEPLLGALADALSNSHDDTPQPPTGYHASLPDSGNLE